MEEQQEFDTDYTDEITCPYCGSTNDESYEYTEDDTTASCGSCGKDFLLSVHVSVDYSTKKCPCMNGEEPHDFKNRDAWYKGMTHVYKCKVCGTEERRDNPNYVKEEK